MTAHDRFIQSPTAGWEDREPCGTTDPRALVLQPVHFACLGCRKVILALSQGRTPMRGTPLRQPHQTPDKANGWNPDDFTRVRK